MIVPICMGIGLSACAGLRAFLPLLVVSVLAHFGYLNVNSNFAILGSTHVMIALFVATGVEILGDKIRAIDNLLHSLGIVLAPVAGSVVASSMYADLDGGIAILLGVMSGGCASGTVHMARSGLRAVATATSFIHQGLGNAAISFIEDASAVVILILAILLPVLGALFAVAMVCVSIYAMKRCWRWLKERKAAKAQEALSASAA